MSLERLEKVSGLVRPLIASNLALVARFLPTLTKYILCLLFLVNARSLPLAWHFRVFRPVFRIRLQYLLLRWRLVFQLPAIRDRTEDEWLDSITPVGEDPFNYTITYESWASIDDSDFNGHMSNSSYAKTLDSARLKTALVMFPMFFRAGGWMPLAATHYSFIREIPMLAKYEVRISIASWDQKWLYIVCKFVTKPSKKTKKTPPRRAFQDGTPTPETKALFHASVRTSAEDITSSPFSTGNTPPESSTKPDTDIALKAVAASLATEEPDGATLHTVSVSQLCFKIGRITVPPGIVLATNGFSIPPPVAAGAASPPAAYSHANPPPHWPRVKAIMSKPVGGSTKALQGLLKGGWRDVLEEERWWDIALGGSVERRRRKRLEMVKALGVGMGGAREM